MMDKFHFNWFYLEKPAKDNGNIQTLKILSIMYV